MIYCDVQKPEKFKIKEVKNPQSLFAYLTQGWGLVSRLGWEVNFRPRARLWGCEK